MTTELNKMTCDLLTGVSSWEDWLSMLADILNLRSIHLATINIQNFSVRWHFLGGVKMPPEDFEYFVSDLLPKDWGVLTAIASSPLDIKSLTTEGILEQATASEFGQKYAKPRDIKDVMTVKIQQDSSWVTMILANSNSKQGPIDQNKISEFSQYLKLIIELVSWQWAKNNSNQAGYLEAVLSLQKSPSAVFDLEGKLVSSNAHFGKRLHQLNITTSPNDLDHWQDDAQLRHFYLAIMEANRAKHEKFTLNSSTYNYPDTKTDFLLTSLCDKTHTPLGVLVSMIERAEVTRIFKEAEFIFGLTPAEMSICHELLSGKTAKEIASKLDKSIYTVRDQIKSILKKTNCTNQSQFLTLIMSLPVATSS